MRGSAQQFLNAHYICVLPLFNVTLQSLDPTRNRNNLAMTVGPCTQSRVASVWHGSTSFKKSKPPNTGQAAQIHASDDGEGDMDDDELEGTVHVIHAMQPGGSLQKCIP
ncbi:hypothetical protein NDU88_001270 [Pleurodeles waltl]|uniref:Uncharacterized protein n=1 Tax=Pleurodeles waltl TaxID=8319 RepID=A0AAV7U8V4_PLEWA|nr:hypothetical protein NDU88_001270 [Pleurodeles waltl]